MQAMIAEISLANSGPPLHQAYNYLLERAQHGRRLSQIAHRL